MSTELTWLVYPGGCVILGWIAIMIYGGGTRLKLGLVALSVMYLFYVVAWQDSTRIITLKQQLSAGDVVVEGTVERVRQYSWGATIDLRPIGLPAGTVLKVFISGQPISYEPEDLLIVQGRAQHQRNLPPRHWLWWDPFDLSEWIISCHDGGVELVHGSHWDLRQFVLRRLEEAHNLQPKSKALLKALLFGDRTELSPKIGDFARRAGVSHLLAISGMHLGMYVTALTFLTRNKRPQLVLAGITLFILLSGGGSSATRAVTSALYFACARWAGSQMSLRDAFWRTLLGLLWLNPAYLFDLGFRLSILAVWALSLYNSVKNNTVRVASLLSSGLLVTSVIMPISAAYFGVINPWGPALTICCSPIVLLLVVSGLASLPFLIFGTADYYYRIAGGAVDRLADWLELILSLSMKLPGVTITVGTIGITLVICCYLLVIKMCKAANVTGCRRNDLLISGSCFLLVFSLLQISALCQTIGGKLSPWLAVTALDVGHGDAFFLQLPGGVQMLVDAGGESDFNPQDWIGRTVVGAYLVSANCTRLDTVIVSHWHSDHFGGLIPVLAQISADSLVSPAGMWPPVIPALDLPSRLVAARRGLGFSQHSCSGVILYPTVCPDVLTNPNSASIIFRLEYASFSMIFTGDIPDKEQKQLAKAQEGRSVVLKVPHHGGHSLNAAWLTEVMPAYAVISGAGTSRGQPNQNTLGKLKKANVRLFCTDTIGNLCLRTDGTDLYVATTAGKANQSLWAANFFAIVLTLL